MADETLSVKVPAELKARIKAEGENLGRSMGGHARSILEQHFEGQSVEQVAGHLSELTSAIERLSQRGGDNEASDGTKQMTAQMVLMRGQIEGLAATLQFVLTTLVYQKDALKPTDADRIALNEHFETMARNFHRRD